jgi:hypothetical protein
VNKRCACCKTEKPAECYYRDRSKPDGRYVTCKDCASAQRKASRLRRIAEDPEGQAELRRKYVRTYRERHPERVKEQYRKQGYRKKYGMTVEQYEAILESQHGVCAICRNPESGRALAVDHDHTSGGVRSLLCSKCNTAIGLLQDSPELADRVADYLRSHTGP